MLPAETVWQEQGYGGTALCPREGRSRDPLLPPDHLAPERNTDNGISQGELCYITTHTPTKHANTLPTCTHLPYLLGAKFAGLGQGHACGMRALQEVPVGGLVALDGRRPVVVGVLGVPCVGPPLQLVPQPLHRPRPLTLQVPVTLQDRETHTITKSAYDYLFPSIAILNPENMISFF